MDRFKEDAAARVRLGLLMDQKSLKNGIRAMANCISTEVIEKSGLSKEDIDIADSASGKFKNS